MRKNLFVLLAVTAALSGCSEDATPVTTSTTPSSITLEFVSRFRHASATGLADGAAEIVAYDPASKRAFVVNGETDTIDVLNLSNPSSPVAAGTLNLDLVGLTNPGRSPNSVSVKNGIVAVAVEDSPKTNNGKVGLYNASTLAFISSATVGALPDMLTFTPDGTKVLVANEGEPADYLAGSADPEGSVSIVTVTNPAIPTVTTVSFSSFNAQLAKLRNGGVRIFGPTNGSAANTTVATDLEPEYIAVSSDSLTAYVVLQENNALATINIMTGIVTNIAPLGAKDHSQIGNALDVSERDGLLTSGNSSAIRIINRPVFGLYMPDGIATYRVNGQDYIVTANEGDAREYAGVQGGTGGTEREDRRVSEAAVTLDSVIFPDATTLKNDVNLGRLRVTVYSGDLDNTNTPLTPELEKLFTFGARSFSIFRPTGELVFDSGSDFEDILSSLRPTLFNISHDNHTVEDRSGSKGPEPESVELATFGGKTYAFIGLERDSGIMIYDITDPEKAFFVNYVTSRVFGAPGAAINDGNFITFGDLGPEGLKFVSAADSGSGQPLLLVANEISGTTAIFRVVQNF